MIGCTPCARADSWNLMAPKRFARSVTASAGMPSAAAAATASSTRAISSTTEYSVCRRRWTKRGEVMPSEARNRAPILPAALREKPLQDFAAFGFQHAALERAVMVPLRERREVHDAA